MSLRLRRPPLWALAVIAAILLVDQVTKAFVLAAADRLPATVVGGIRLEIVRNTGVSFSLFTGRGWLVTLMVGLVTLVMLVLFVTLPRRYSLPLALLLGGSLGNLIDRFRVGYVVDFVALYWWPRFNVADLAIIAGAVLMVLTVMLHPAVRPALATEGSGELQDIDAVRTEPCAGNSEVSADKAATGAASASTPQLAAQEQPCPEKAVDMPAEANDGCAAPSGTPDAAERSPDSGAGEG